MRIISKNTVVMIQEIAYVVDFITAFLTKSNILIPYKSIIAFKQSLIQLLVQNYSKYWNEKQPNVYKNLRSIKFSYSIDYIVLKAWAHKDVKLPIKLAYIIFPVDLLIFCDPKSVTYKLKNKVFTLYKL